MRIEETTYQLNIRVLGKDDSTARVQVENLDPMTREEFWEFLLRASKAEELPKSARPSREVWRDTREHPMPKHKLKEMDEFNKIYKMFKRKFPLASQELLAEKTRQYISQRATILEDFQAALASQLQACQGTKEQADVLAWAEEPGEGKAEEIESIAKSNEPSSVA